MYTGVKNHHVLPNVASYEDATRALAIWDSKPRRGKQVISVHRAGDSIAFQLYFTDVVVWEPDNSVLIDNYGTQTTSGFARQFLPRGIWLHHPVYRRTTGQGGASTIGFKSDPDADQWSDRSSICQGTVVRFAEQDGLWLPDLDTCYEITLPTKADAKRSRELAKLYHFKEFESWLSMAPMHLGDVEHSGWDLDDCMEALGKRDWRAAAESLPLIEDTGAYGRDLRESALPIWTAHTNEYVTMGSLAKLKLAIWDRFDVLATETARSWSRREYDRGMARVRQMTKLGINTRQLGPVE